MNVYAECVKRGIKVWSHESDLYVFVTEETTKIKEEFEKDSGIKIQKFRCEGAVDKGKMMYDFPFQYTPFWEKKRC